MGCSLKGNNLFQGANTFLYAMTISFEKGGKNENDRVASPASVPIHLLIDMPDCSFNTISASDENS